MTAVTVTDRKEITGIIGMEVVVVTFSTGNTYTSKFGKVHAAFINNETRTGARVSAISGGTITLTCTSASSDTAELVIFGS